MTQQRLSETDEEYEKRKKRVAATYRNLGFGLAHGGGALSTVLANIIYNMDTFNTDPSTKVRSIDNAGLDGAFFDAPLNAAQGMEFTGTQYIETDTTDVTSLWLFDYSTNTFDIITSPANPFKIELGTYGHYFKLYVTHEAGDVTLVNTNPELVLKLALGETTDLSWVDTDMKLFIPQKESGQYIQCVSEDLGSEEIINGDFTTDTSNWSAFHSTIASVGGNLEITGTTTYPAATQLLTLTVGEKYIFKIDIREQIIDLFIAFSSSGGSHANLNLLYGTAGVANDGLEVGTHYIIFTATSSMYLWIGTTTDTTTPLRTVDNVSIKELTADEAINFDPTQYTNADLLDTGVPSTMFKQDALGRPTALADNNLLEYNGDDRYAEIIVMPASDSAWELDMVMECLSDSTEKVSGCYATTATERFYMGQSDNANGGLFGYLGTTQLGSPSTVVSDGLHHISIQFNGVGGGNFVVDNTITYPFSGSDYTYSVAESLFIGTLSRARALYTGSAHTKPIGYTQFIAKARTVAERDADYNKAMALYP